MKDKLSVCRIRYIFNKSFILEVLLERRIIDEITGCWLYTGKLHRTGYAYIEINHKSLAVHRISLWIHSDFDLNSSLSVLHKTNCPYKHCFNPEHLYSGTQEQNIADSIHLGNHVIFGRKS